MKNKRIDTLNGGRFFAMLLIVFSHFDFLSAFSFGNFYNKHINNATLGVDYFFMLSGFGMMYSAFAKATSSPPPAKFKNLIKFALNRVKKIYPLYIFALGIGFAYRLIFVILPSGDILNGVITMLKQLILCLFLIQSATGIEKYSHAFCGTCWFLSSLFCVYLVSPILINFFKKHIKSIGICILTLGILCAANFTLVHIFRYIQSKTIFDMLSYASPYRRVLYVAFGMLLAVLYNLKGKKGNIEYLAIPIACIYFFVRNYITAEVILTYTSDMLVCGFALYSIATGSGIFSKFLASKPIVYLGNLSMYVFIIHYLLRLYFVQIFDSLSLNPTLIAFIKAATILILPYFIAAFINKISNKTHKNSTVISHCPKSH